MSTSVNQGYTQEKGYESLGQERATPNESVATIKNISFHNAAPRTRGFEH